jgi:hypothetical protein
MIHDDLHMMPPTTSFALDEDRMDHKYRYARRIFDLSRELVLFGRQRTMDALRLDDTSSGLEASRAGSRSSFFRRLFGTSTGRKRRHSG